MVEEIKSALQALAIAEKRDFFPRFFKTGKGEYGEGDRFIGVTVPDQRKVAKAYQDRISLDELGELLSSEVHEHRHCALILLVGKFEKSRSSQQKKEMVDFYLSNLAYINNWDLVDASCYKLLGRYCFENDEEEVLMTLSASDEMWHKRMAVVSTMYHVKKGRTDLTRRLVLSNMNHPHDLMHKANGWLLREMGKANPAELRSFLEQYAAVMPRTTLRYAVEKLDVEERRRYMEKNK
ncbi:DNA alkylation repair protein [Bergeyella sp. RCAD1439]|uniref:DNA alkylation repair protein n=1 Tax=Bergeyella anatis TaxID=3113737 RepID=UPI002E1879E5|nr:DNA alkylation repair protein [Bergeyella sp. RCAD1439]